MADVPKPGTPVSGCGIKVFVICFKKPVVEPEQIAIGRAVRAVENPVLVLNKESSSCVRLAPQFIDAGTEFDKRVGILIEQFADRCNILGIVSEVRADERRVRVARDDPVPLS